MNFAKDFSMAKRAINTILGTNLNPRAVIVTSARLPYTAAIFFEKPASRIKLNPSHPGFRRRRAVVHETAHLFDFTINGERSEDRYRNEFIAVTLTMAVLGNNPYTRPTEVSGYPYWNVLQWIDENGLDKALQVTKTLLLGDTPVSEQQH